METDVKGAVRDLGPAPECRSVRPLTYFDGQAVHIVRSVADRLTGPTATEPATWWVMGADGKGARVAAEKFPHVAGVHTSSHYGLVALVDPKGSGHTALCTIKLDAPIEKK